MCCTCLTFCISVPRCSGIITTVRIIYMLFYVKAYLFLLSANFLLKRKKDHFSLQNHFYYIRRVIHCSLVHIKALFSLILLPKRKYYLLLKTDFHCHNAYRNCLHIICPRLFLYLTLQIS